MRLGPDVAVHSDEFHALMLRFFPQMPRSRLGLAVSGGPDSMALALLAKGWSAAQSMPLPLAFIVDHGLRSSSADEARLVKTRLQQLGIEAEILPWDHGPIAAKLHQEARKARYRLLIEACKKRGIDHLAFAHQRDDQAETILMRFAKGTGIDGLAGIPFESRLDGVHILRPLLTVPKSRLIATCAAAGIGFVTDPSNDLEKFARGRLRRVMPLLANEGLTVERLVDFAVRATEARDALAHYTLEFLADASRQSAYGEIVIDKKKLLAVPRAIALRGLGLALQTIHASDYAPRHESLSLLLDALGPDKTISRKSLNGCLVGERGGDVILIREFSAIHDMIPVQGGDRVLWDGRWRVSLPADGGVFELRALGNPSRELLDRLAPGLRHKVPQGSVRAVLPALWQGEKLVGLPLPELISVWPP